MKRNLLSMIIALLVFVSGFAQNKQEPVVKKTKSNKEIVASNGNLTKKQVNELRKKHAYYLANNPVNKNFHLPKSERKAAGIPPNKYMEQQFLLKMDPNTGRPAPENLELIRQELQRQRDLEASNRIPGDAVGNAWIERGPNNVGGRTRAIIFDPVAGGNAVVAGGVSGGLWKNADITGTGAWTRVSTFPVHVNVQNITVDPNNASTWYVGTGESYVGGDVNGNGAWKTTDAGATWTQIYGGGTTTTTSSFAFNLEVTGSTNPALNRGYETIIATAFGPALTNMTYPMVLMDDLTAPDVTDACEQTPGTPYTNKIVLIRRGSCSFESKVVKAQNAGARAVIIMNNVPGGPVGMAEDAAENATIPCVMVSQADGDLLAANFTGNATLRPTGVGEFTGKIVSGIQMINEIVIKNTDIYMAVSDGIYSNARNNTLFGSGTYGLYKSTNGGTTWTKLTLPTAPSGNATCPNDIEISANGDIWVSSRDSWTFGDGGGKVFRSQDNGASFQQMYLVTANGGGSRVELEPSISDQNTMYILSELNQADTANPTIEVQLLRSVNATAANPTFTAMALPAGNETRETTYGFTGAQAFYNLMIECDPTNPEVLYLGGIDLYRSANAKTGATVTWTALSDWTINVHSDQHALTFKPGAGNNNIGLFGNDGGVYYSSSLSTASNAVARNNGFNVTQFVGMAVQPNGVTGATGDFFVAGAQDNGSQYFSGSTSLATSTAGASAGINGTYEVQGGDGGKPVFSQDSDKYYITNYVYNDNIRYRTIGSATTRQLNGISAADQSMGLFYPAMTLDNTNDILYSDFTGGNPVTFQVRRYTTIKGPTSVVRTNLANATFLNSYPTAIIPGKTTPTTLYIGTMNSRLLKLTNANTVTAANSLAGTGWSNISGPAFVGSISDVEFGANDNQIFVTMYNYGVNNIWYTPNGGTNWYRIEGDLPDMPVNAILQNPLNSAELMIGTDLGVWYANTFNPAGTTDQALAWKQSYNGMSSVAVTDLDLQANLPAAPTAYNVYAATYGRGVFSGPLTNTVLSIDENDLVDKSINVYPTVSNGNVTINADKSYGKTTLELFDITGKIVYSNLIELDANANQINFGTLSTGNYILKLSGDNFKTTKRLIIQ